MIESKNIMKISWIVPVFNSGVLLTEALDSLAGNRVDGVEFEIIVIDDCSYEPTTLNILTQLEDSGEVRVLRQPENAGPARARNVGMKAATGEWIAFLDADDMLAEGAVAVRVKAIAALPDVEWLAGDMLEIREAGVQSYFHSFAKATQCGAEVIPGVFLIRNPLQKLATWPMLPLFGSMMFKRDLVDRIGLLDEGLHYGEDLHYCLVAASAADLAWVVKPTLLLRRYHESMTKDLVRGARHAPMAVYACLRDVRLRTIRKQMRWQYSASLRSASNVFRSSGARWQAFKYAMRALFWSPNDQRSLRTLANVFYFQKP